MAKYTKRALVVEDEIPLLDAIGFKLERNGFEVVKARTVEKAKEHFSSIGSFDIIWLDHYLIGDENGLDFFIWCKEHDVYKNKKIPVFVVSNTLSNDKATAYINQGAEKFFVKSNYKLEEIIKEINKVLSREVAG